MAEYREIAPPPHLAGTIECFWTMRHQDAEPSHRVLPDGCADILFTRDANSAAIEAVGPMTRFRDFPQPAGRVFLGMRFRPGMWTAHLGIPGDEITDATLPLDSLWGSRATELRDRLAEASTLEQCLPVVESSLPQAREIGPIERALAWMAECHGLVSMDDLAGQAGLSARQFRRICLARTGLTPKFLARVLRFRYALQRLHAHPCAFAHMALDCGYYDQAHFINEFRELSGHTPGATADGRFFQSL